MRTPHPRASLGEDIDLQPADFGLDQLSWVDGRPLYAPPLLDTAVGYEGDHRYVSFHLLPDGRAAVEDGACVVVGDSQTFYLWAHHPSVWPVLVSAHSASDPEPHVVLDRTSRRLYSAGASDAYRFLAATSRQAPQRSGTSDCAASSPPLPSPSLWTPKDEEERAEYWRARARLPITQAAAPRISEWLDARPLPCPTCDADLTAGDYVAASDGRPACPVCAERLYGPALFDRLGGRRPPVGYAVQVEDLRARWAVDAAGLQSGQARALAGPDGLKVILRVNDPAPETLEAIESGQVGIGVQESPDGTGALLLGLGDPERPGYLVVPLDAGDRVEWWGASAELALFDETGTIRARCRFAASDFGASGEGPSPEAGATVRVAVVPEHGYGLMQLVGPLTARIIVESGLALAGSPDWRAGFTEVWDLRAVTEVNVPPSALPLLDRVETETRGALAGSRTLLLVPPRRLLLHYAARTYARMARDRFGRAVVVCRTVEEVTATLGVDNLPALSERGSLSNPARVP